MRRPLKYGLDVVLLLAAALVFGTGLLVDRLDLNDFLPHRWAGYGFAGLALVHIGMRWRAFVPVRRGRPGDERGSREAAPAPHDPAAPPDAAARPGDGTAGTTAVRPGPRVSRRAALTTTVGAGLTGAAAGWFAGGRSAAELPGDGDVGMFYHRESSLGAGSIWGGLVNWGSAPAAYKRVGDAPTVPLPTPARLPDLPLAQALRQRRSLRSYASRALTRDELAWVLSAATGVTSADGYRTAPSAGALYPIETYVAVERVEQVDPGLYHLDVRALALEPLRTGSAAGDLVVAGLGQDFLRAAPVVLVLTGLFQRTRWKYQERHYRYVCWEAGHIAQNVSLAAEAAGLGVCVVGAFLDGMVNDLLAVDGRDEAALGLIALGPR